MATQIIPLTSDPNQILEISLEIDQAIKKLQLEISYNAGATYWTMNVLDKNTGSYLLTSIPLITGEYPAANILGQYAYLGIGSACVVNAGSVAADWPGETNLGSEFVLCWGDSV
jgi:hypothetical protein